MPHPTPATSPTSTAKRGPIWYKRSWSTTLKVMFDGLIYSALTAGMFGWLWPR